VLRSNGYEWLENLHRIKAFQLTVSSAPFQFFFEDVEQGDYIP
jgi:hypothetical protein